MPMFTQQKWEDYVLGGIVLGYPIGHEVEGEHDMPCLARYSPEHFPDELVAFNDLSRAKSPSKSAIHFYKEDRLFARIASEPGRFTLTASPFQSVLTPDISLSDKMPKWKRIENTVISRMCGVVWASQGLSVIPSLRWTGPEDYDFVAAGLAGSSTLAVSSYGIQRSDTGMRVFNEGLSHFVERLQPKNLMIFGSARDIPKRWIELGTNVRFYKPNQYASRTKVKAGNPLSDTDEISLFV